MSNDREKQLNKIVISLKQTIHNYEIAIKDIEKAVAQHRQFMKEHPAENDIQRANDRKIIVGYKKRILYFKNEIEKDEKHIKKIKERL